MPMRSMSDAMLLSAAAAGDQRAFTTIVERHSGAVYRHALRIFGDAQAAEDATQEVFIKVFRALDTFDGRAKFTTWLFRVTRNACLDMIRAGRRTPRPVDPLTLEPIAEADFSDQIVLAGALEEAMASLPPEEREALAAVTLYGLTYADAGVELGIPAGTVKSRVFRARKSLFFALRGPEGGAIGGLPQSQ